MIRDLNPLPALGLRVGLAVAVSCTVLIGALSLAGPAAAQSAQDAKTAAAKAKAKVAAADLKADPTKVAAADKTKGAATGKSAKDPKDPKGVDKAAKDAAAKGDKTGEKPGTKTAKAEVGETAKPSLVGTFGDWGAYLAAGKAKTCYALGQPKDRNPAALKRDPGYIFISTRPGENVRNEVSIAMGFDVKAVPEAKAEVGSSSFAMVAKGGNLWVKNAAEEGQMLEAMRKSGKLVVRAASMKGNVTVNSYSLSGLGQALDRVKRDCP